MRLRRRCLQLLQLITIVNGLTTRTTKVTRSRTGTIVVPSQQIFPKRIRSSRQSRYQHRHQHHHQQQYWTFYYHHALLLQSFTLSTGLDEISEITTDFFDDANNNNYPTNVEDNDDNDNNNNNDVDWASSSRATLPVASTLSQFSPIYESDVPFIATKGHDAWLDRSTNDMLDFDLFPLGRLTLEDVDSITGLMAAWVRRRSVEAALTVERLLKRVVDDMRANNKAVQVTARMYTIAIDAWAKSNANGRAQRAQHIHDAMVQMYQETQDPLIKPSTISFNTLMNAHCKSLEQNAAQLAENVFQEMLTMYEQGDDNVKPDSVTFCTMMDCYAKANPPNSTERSEELFRMMDTLGVQRTVYTFSALQTVYGRSGRPDAPQKAEAILHSMLDLYHTKGDVFAKPNSVNYNAVLGALSRTPSRASVQRAHALLQQMELPVSQGGFDVEPDRLSYALTILCCSRCPDDEIYGATLAESNLLKMEARAKQELAKKQELSSAAPPLVSMDVECFNVVLTAISKCPQLPNAVDRAIAIVRRMEEYAKQPQMEQLRPNVRTWNAVLNVLARSKDKKAARKAEQILNHMHDLHGRGIANCKPDAFSFAAVLSAYQKSSEAGAAQRADDILSRMETLFDRGEIDAPPDVFHYTIVCGAWAKSARLEPYRTMAADRCLQILTHMMERDRAGFSVAKPNVRTFNAVLDCLSRSKQEDKAEQLLYFMLSLYRQGDRQCGPDEFSFNSVINAMTRTRNREGGKRAETILERYLEYHLHENPRVRPDCRAFTHIIAHYGRSSKPDAPYRAEYVLNRMISLFKSGDFPEMAPNNFAISTVIDAYTHTRHPDAGRCAERLLQLFRELQQSYGATKLVLNSAVMNSVLHAWAVCGDENAGRFAELHLDEMERSYYELGRVEVRPDTRSYGLVLHAWSKSSSFDKARRALQILRRMQLAQTRNDNVLPSEHVYSLVINACAFSDCNSPEVQEEAFDIAVTVFDELLAHSSAVGAVSSSSLSPEHSLRPSSLAFGWFLQACDRLKVPEKAKYAQIERAFTTCCELGLVNDFVLHRFRIAAPEPMYQQLLAPVLNRRPPPLPDLDDYDDGDLTATTSDDDDVYRSTKSSSVDDANEDESENGILSVQSLFPRQRPKRQTSLRVTMSQLPHNWTKNVAKHRYFPSSTTASFAPRGSTPNKNSDWDSPLDQP